MGDFSMFDWEDASDWFEKILLFFVFLLVATFLIGMLSAFLVFVAFFAYVAVMGAYDLTFGSLGYIFFMGGL